jgi:hypothetical protein
VKAGFSPANGFGAGAVSADVAAAGAPVESRCAATATAQHVTAASDAAMTIATSVSAGRIHLGRRLGFGTVSLLDESSGRSGRREPL